MKALLWAIFFVWSAANISATSLSSSTILHQALGDGVVSFSVEPSGIAGASAESLAVGIRTPRLPSGQFGSGYDLVVDCRLRCGYYLYRGAEALPVPLAPAQYDLTGRYRVEVFDSGSEVTLRVERNDKRVFEYRDTSPGALLAARATAVVNLYSFDSRPAVVLRQAVATEASPFWRAYNPTADYHFFTLSYAEYLAALRGGYRGEGATFFGLKSQLPGSAPLYRLYNRNNGRHYFTMDAAERDGLVLRGAGAWVYELIAGYLYPVSHPAGKEIFKLYNTISGAHLYVDSVAEKDAILSRFRGIWVAHTSLGRAP